MILKIFRCRVALESRDAFLRGQQRWSSLAGLNGFVAQCCGFDRSDPAACVILAQWTDRDAYDRFMSHDHDPIAAAAGQAGLYEDARVILVNDAGSTAIDRASAAATWGSARFVALGEARSDADSRPVAVTFSPDEPPAGRDRVFIIEPHLTVTA